MKKILKKVTLLLAAGIIALSSQTSVYALDEIFTIGNGIFYYNPEEQCLGVTEGCGAEFNFATFNICYGNEPGKTPDESRPSCARGVHYEPRLKKTVSVIKNYDIAALQEVREVQHRDMMSADMLGSDYDIFPATYSTDYASQNPIVWNTNIFELVEGTKIPGATVTGSANQANAYSQVKLRYKETGQLLYAISVHEPVGADNGAAHRRTVAANNLVKAVNSLSSEGVPVVLAGDFNSKMKACGVTQNAEDCKRENLPYCILTDNTGLWNAYDAKDEKKGKCPSDVGYGVDHIYTDTGNTVSDFNFGSGINTGGVSKNGSDHPTVSAKITIQGRCGDSSGDNTPLTGADNAEKAWNFLTGNGLSGEQAAGIIGNLIAESSLDPRANNSGNYYGIAQWDTANRWSRLRAWAKSNDLDEWKFDTQIRYLWKEGTERGNIKGLKENKEQDVAHLTWYWGRYFEVAIISGDPDQYPHNLQHFEDARKPAAEKTFAQFSGTSGNSVSAFGSSESTPTDSGSACSNKDTQGSDSIIGAGEGDFIDSGEVNGWSIVRDNAILVDRVWGDKLEWNGWCASIVARTWQGSATAGFGYADYYAMTLWADHRELVHTDHKAPKGSILIYSGSTVYGHVTIYLGNNKILNDGHIVDATVSADRYLGWVDPNDLTWQKPQKLTDVGFMSEYQGSAGI